MRLTYERSLPAKSGGGLLAGNWGQRLLRGSGIVLDTGARAARDAVRARFASLAHESDLYSIARECKLYRAYDESIDAFRARVQAVWSSAKYRGTEHGLLSDLALMGATNCEVKERWFMRYGAGAVHEAPSFRRGAKWWSLIVRPPHPFGTDFSAIWGTVGDGGSGKNWQDGTVWGFADASYSTSYLVWLMRYHCPPDTIAREVIIVLDGDVDDAGESIAPGKSASMDVSSLTHPSRQSMQLFSKSEVSR